MIPPLASALKPKVFTTRLGAKTVLHDGSVRYPCSAFAPGAKVKVIAIPESGSNFEITVSADTQIMYSPERKGLAFNLVGLQMSDVEGRLGKAKQVDSQRWSYEFNSGMFYVIVNGDGMVVNVDPRTIPLSVLEKR